MSLASLLTAKPAATRPANANGHTQPAVDGPQYQPNPDLREDDRIQVPEFPFEIFPERIRKVIDDCNLYLSYPRDFTAAGILAATAIAIGRTYKAVYQWEETACIYLALVAPPGTAKTHPLLFALHPIIQANKKAIRDYNEQREALETAQITKAPTDRQCLFGDFTIEALLKAATQNRRGISVYMDELRGFFSNFNRYNAGSEQEFWLQNWSGSPYAVTRMGRKYFLEWLSICIVGTIQPSLLDEIGKGGRAHNGFVERILFCYPDNVPVIRLRRRNERSDTRHILQRHYAPVIQHMLDKNLAIYGNETEEDQANELYFSPEADDLLTDFINILKSQMAEKENEYIRNVYSKMQTYAIRFCILINRLRQACEYQTNKDFPPDDDHTILSDDVAKATLLTEYFLHNALKAHNDISGATPVNKLPRDVQRFYRALPIGREVNTQALEELAVTHNMSRASLFRLLNETHPERKLFAKIRHGVYERLY